MDLYCTILGGDQIGRWKKIRRTYYSTWFGPLRSN